MTELHWRLALVPIAAIIAAGMYSLPGSALPLDDPPPPPATPGDIKGRVCDTPEVLEQAAIDAALCILEVIDPEAYARLTAPGVTIAELDMGPEHAGAHDHDTIGVDTTRHEEDQSIIGGADVREIAVTLSHESKHQARAKDANLEFDPVTAPMPTPGKDVTKREETSAEINHMAMRCVDANLICSFDTYDGQPAGEDCPGMTIPPVDCEDFKKECDHWTQYKEDKARTIGFAHLLGHISESEKDEQLALLECECECEPCDGQ